MVKKMIILIYSVCSTQVALTMIQKASQSRNRYYLTMKRKGSTSNAINIKLQEDQTIFISIGISCKAIRAVKKLQNSSLKMRKMVSSSTKFMTDRLRYLKQGKLIVVNSKRQIQAGLVNGSEVCVKNACVVLKNKNQKGIILFHNKNYPKKIRIFLEKCNRFSQYNFIATILKSRLIQRNLIYKIKIK